MPNSANGVYQLRTRQRVDILQGALEADPQLANFPMGGYVNGNFDISRYGDNSNGTNQWYFNADADSRGAAVAGIEYPEVFSSDAARAARANSLTVSGFAGDIAITAFSGENGGYQELGTGVYRFTTTCESIPPTN